MKWKQNRQCRNIIYVDRANDAKVFDMKFVTLRSEDCEILESKHLSYACILKFMINVWPLKSEWHLH